MTDDADVFYEALTARDARFDGTFFVAVTSTGIYCRPVCPARTPQRKNCLFFASAQEAERARFRPCLRCRPELAPGNAPVDDAQRIAQLIVRRLDDGRFDDSRLEAIAAQFGLSSRQIRRIVQRELGVPPIQLILTRRLLLAKQLLTETRLPITEVAFASGFASVRRFNDAFRSRYGLAPSGLRKQAAQNDATTFDGAATSTLQLAYRPPYDWTGVLAFLAGRTLVGIEWATDEFYARTVRLGDRTGWIKIRQAKQKNTLSMEFTHGLTPVLPAVLRRVRDLFDLDARPDLISKQLAKDARLAPLVERNPGLRVPGAFDGFEMGVRAIIGQQVTVKAATTLARRFATTFGEGYVTPFAELNRLSPAAASIATTTVDDIAKLGIVGARAKSIVTLAQAHVAGEVSLESRAHDPHAAIERLTEIPGIGQWTAHYIAMRALRWPDAFPKEDIAVRNNLGRVSAKEAEVLSQAWRPWRSYAVLHIWRGLAAAATPGAAR